VNTISSISNTDTENNHRDDMAQVSLNTNHSFNCLLRQLMSTACIIYVQLL